VTCVQFRKARVRNLRQLYQNYYINLSDNQYWPNIKLENPKLPVKLNFQSAFTLHILHTIYAKLSAVARSGSISSAFQSLWNPLVLEVLKGGKVIGCVFLERQSKTVFELESFVIWSEVEHSIILEVVSGIQEYIKCLGASRIVIKSSDSKLLNVLHSSGFDTAFCDEVLFLDF